MLNCPICNKQVDYEKNARAIEIDGKCLNCLNIDYINSKIPVKFANATFENAIKTKDNSNIIKSLNEFKTTLNKGKFGFIFIGNVGTGKTYLMYAFIKRYLLRHFIFNHFSDLILKLRNASINADDPMKLLNELTETPNLFIDDFGTAKPSEFAVEQIGYIINKRYENQKMIFISTNLSLEDIKTQWGERIYSRIVEHCEIYPFKGEDFRTK